MSEDGRNILNLMTEVRSLCEEISALLKTADTIVEASNWSSITGNTVTSGNSGHIDYPEYWVPELFYRFYTNGHPNKLLYIAVILDNREDNSDYLLEGKDKFEEPILTAGYFNYENESFLQKILSSTDKGKYCKGHFFSDDSSYNGIMCDLTPDNIKSFVKKTEPKDEGLVKWELKSLALPLIDIKDTAKIEKSVIKPLLTDMI